NDDKLVYLPLSRSAGDLPCISTDVGASQTFPSNVTARNADVYLGTAEGAVRAFVFDSGNWIRNTAWGGGVGYVGIGDTTVSGLALTSQVFGTTKLRGLFVLDP